MLEIYFEDKHFRVQVPPELSHSAQDLFDRMDRDMDAGWQMGPEFVERPDAADRARIAASRLVVALEQGNEALAQAMTAYIEYRLPGVAAVHIDTGGQMRNTRFMMGTSGSP